MPSCEEKTEESLPLGRPSGKFLIVIMLTDAQPLFYVLGLPWLPFDGTFAAAILALIAAAGGWVFGQKNANRAAHDLKENNEATAAELTRVNNANTWWTRFQEATTLLQSKREKVREAGMVLLVAQGQSELATDAEKSLVVAYLGIFDDSIGAGN